MIKNIESVLWGQRSEIGFLGGKSLSTTKGLDRSGSVAIIYYSRLVRLLLLLLTNLILMLSSV